MNPIVKLFVDYSKMIEQRLPEFLDLVADYLPESLVSSIKSSLNEKTCMSEAEASHQIWKTIYWTTAALFVPFAYLLYVIFSKFRGYKKKCTVPEKEEIVDAVTEISLPGVGGYLDSSDDELLLEDE